MGANVSRNSFDYKNIEIVPVIAGFDENGKVIPIYVKIQGKKLKVTEFWVKSKFAGISEYHCKIMNGDTEFPLLLSYYNEESLWVIPHR